MKCLTEKEEVAKVTCIPISRHCKQSQLPEKMADSYKAKQSKNNKFLPWVDALGTNNLQTVLNMLHNLRLRLTFTRRYYQYKMKKTRRNSKVPDATFSVRH